MSTPFDKVTVATAERMATAAQLQRAIGPMLGDRNWQEGPSAYSARCAAIKTVLKLVTDHADALSASITVTGDLEVDFANGMAECAKHAEPGTENIWKPLTLKGASAMIDWLGQQQWANRRVSTVEEANVAKAKTAVSDARSIQDDVPPITVVPAGRYAVPTEDGATNTLAFYKVDRPTEGRWTGYVFVKLMVSDEEQRMSRAAGNAILHKIAKIGAAEASAAYGHEIGRCGICARTLTNDESRERGIGPICAAKQGW